MISTITPEDTIVKCLNDLTQALKEWRNTKGAIEYDTLQKLDELLNKMKSSAKGVLPHLSSQIDAGLSLKDISENYKQYAAQILERDPNQIDMFQGPFLDAFGNAA